MKPDPAVRHIVVIQGEARPPVDVDDEPQLMTFPHLVVRELLALLAISIVLVVAALLFDAPLEELANPTVAPNPAKAPWYFLGLQELLHYYPPLISGVILPGIVVAALVIIPYFEVNLRRRPLWESADRSRTLAGIGVGVAILSAILLFTGAHPVWPVLVPLWVTVGLALLPPFGKRSLAFWIFSWFLASTVTLTVIGVFFRGPGWSFVLPWRDGLFY
ncbi:MAG: hypothetical protein AMXMBFR64_15800 [Myxococcales bacterium]